MKKRDNTCLPERGVAASSLLKPLATAVGRQFWYWVAAVIGSVVLALLAWQFTGGPAAGSNAQIPVATMQPALALVPGVMSTARQEPIPPSNLSPFGAFTANTTNTAALAATFEPPVPVPALAAPGAEPGNGPLILDQPASGTAVPNAISAGPSPRSDMRYQAAETWRRAMPH